MDLIYEKTTEEHEMARTAYCVCSGDWPFALHLPCARDQGFWRKLKKQDSGHLEDVRSPWG